MRIENTTNYPDEIVKELVRFGVGEHYRKLRVAVMFYYSRYKAYRGFCEWGKIVGRRRDRRTQLMKRATRRIVVKVGSPSLFPAHTRYWKTLPQVRVLNWMEAIVLISAHEAYHHFQMESGLPISEKYADKYAMKRMLLWRKEGKDELRQVAIN